MDDVLCCNVYTDDDSATQLMIPTTLVEAVLQLVHNMLQAGHPGRDRTLTAARHQFYWPTMHTDVEKHVAKCLSCMKTKGTTKTAPTSGYPPPEAPFDTVGIDVLQLPRSLQGSPYVRPRVCKFFFLSNFVVPAPLPNKSAVTVPHDLVSKLICP